LPGVAGQAFQERSGWILKRTERMATQDRIVIGRSPAAETAKLAYIGKEYAEGKLGRRVYFDLAVPHRLMVFGQTGNGKSYTLGVLSEEIADQNAGSALILDPMSIFWALKKPNDKSLIQNHWGIKGKSYNARLFALKGSIPEAFAGAASAFALHGHEFSADEILRILRIPERSQMASAVQTGIAELAKKIDQKVQNPHYSLDDIANQTSRSYRGVIHPSTRNALDGRFLAARSWGVFDAGSPSLEEVVNAKGLAVVQLGWLDRLGKSAPTDTLFNVVSDALIRARHRLIKNEYIRRSELHFLGKTAESDPTWLILDEAKKFVPTDRGSQTKEIIEDWVQQGRNYGASIVVATQSPELIDERVIAQADIVIAHRLQTDENIRALAKGVRGLREPAVRAVLDDLPAEPGFAAVFEGSLVAPLIIKVRNRKSRHEGGVA